MFPRRKLGAPRFPAREEFAIGLQLRARPFHARSGAETASTFELQVAQVR